MKKKIYILFLLTATDVHLHAMRNNTTPTLVLRSQGFHADRQKMVGLVDQVHLYSNEALYGTMNIGVAYTRSFRGDRLARSLFGDDIDCCTGCPTIKVQGSQIASRDSKAWLADYLYLPCTFDGSFSVNPRIENVIVDFDFFLGLDEWVNGMYFRIYGPFCWTKWQTNFCEGDSVSTNTCPIGYFTPTGSEKLLESITAYFKGDSVAGTDDIIFDPLRKAKMDCACDDTHSGLAEIRMLIGWNILQDENYCFGINVQGAAPAGNKRDGTLVMQPLVGNGSHWELGAGFNFMGMFWRSEDEEKHIGFYLDATFSHLFETRENRTYDYDNKDNSRYMLLVAFDSPPNFVGNLTSSEAEVSAASLPNTSVSRPRAQFDQIYSPLANLSTLNVDVSIPFQADVVAMLNVTAGGFSWDIGYDFWGRSWENRIAVSEIDACSDVTIANQSEANTWGFKGDAREYGFDVANNSGAIPLSATQIDADIHQGTNATAVAIDGFGNPTIRNLGVDEARFAYGDSTGGNSNLRLIGFPDGANNQANHIKTSDDPVFINACDLAYTQQQTRGISHTVFSHLSYTWERDNWLPYLGVGGSVEFGRGGKCTDKSEESSECNTGTCEQDKLCGAVESAITQWSVWLKFGISFY